MKNTIGSSFMVTLFGESHGEAVGAVIDGLAPGIRIDSGFISSQLELRRPYGKISTPRREKDEFRIVSGIYDGVTTGTPVCIIIPNTSQNSSDYTANRGAARPGHADYTAFIKYHGHEDFRGGGHFSGRITAALTAAGAVALTALKGKNIKIGTHISRMGGVSDRALSQDIDDLNEEIALLNGKRFAVLDENAAEAMEKAVLSAADDGDSVGGVLETAVTGLPAGIGEPWFDTIEGVLAHGLFSIPGIKGVQFGGGFDLADARGSEFNDPLYIEDGKIFSRTNNNGGVNGGITNGMPVLFRCAVKPTPSIRKEQETVDLLRKEGTVISTGGRHDPAIIHRARVVVDSMAAIILCDMLALRYGTDWFSEDN